MSAILDSMKAAIAHHQAGRFDQAEAMYKAVLKQEPTQADALHLTGLIAHQQGRHSEAAQQIRAAIGQNSAVPTYYNSLGAAERASGRLDHAEMAFKHALRIDPAQSAAWSNLIGVFDMQGNTNGMEAALDAWVESCPDSTQAILERAAHHTQEGRLPQAIADHRRCAAIVPTDPAPLLSVGILSHQAGDDAAALAAFTRARACFFDTRKLGKATVQSKLDHDIEQIQWLVHKGWVPDNWMDIADAYAAARVRLFGSGRSALKGTPIDPQTQAQIGQWYNQPIHVRGCPARPGGALSQDFDGARAQARYHHSKPGITWADDLLCPEALSDLREFCMASTIWTDFRYAGGYVGTALSNGFANGLLLQIARELRERLPDVIGPHPLRQMWAYKYDQHLTGIGPHADEAAINVNFWITPDSANLNPQTGGLVVWRRCAPLEWDFQAFNRQPDKLMDWARRTKAEELHVPYRCNRAVIFDSNLIHRTGDLNFAPGYENRRINITMLFGQRGRDQ